MISPKAHGSVLPVSLPSVILILIVIVIVALIAYPSARIEYSTAPSWTRLDEVLRMSPTSIETTCTRIALPEFTRSIRFFVINTSRHEHVEY